MLDFSLSLLLVITFVSFVCLFYYKFVKAQASPLFRILGLSTITFLTYTTTHGRVSLSSLSSASLIRTVVVVVAVAVATLLDAAATVATAAATATLTVAATLPLSLPFVSLCALRDVLQLNIPYWISETFSLCFAQLSRCQCSFGATNAAFAQSFLYKARLRLRRMRVNNRHNNFCFSCCALCCFHSPFATPS